LSTYADAVTAFALVQSITFSFGLASKDLRESILKTPHLLVPSLVILASFFYGTIVVLCHYGEDALIGKPDSKSPVDRWTRYARYLRLFVILAVTALALVALGFTFAGAASTGPSL